MTETPAPDGAPPELHSLPVRYEADDLVALSKLVGRSPRHIILLAAGALVVLLSCVILAQVWVLTGWIDLPSISLVIFMSIAVLIICNRRVRAHMWLKVAGRSPLSGPHSYAIGASGLRISSPRSSSEVKWAAFTDVKQTDERLFLFMTRRQAFIVPARAFDRKEDFEAFASAAVERWEGGFSGGASRIKAGG